MGIFFTIKTTECLFLDPFVAISASIKLLLAFCIRVLCKTIIANSKFYKNQNKQSTQNLRFIVYSDCYIARFALVFAPKAGLFI